MIGGAEHVSFSAVATLATAAPRSRGWSRSCPITVAGDLQGGAAFRYRAPVWTRTSQPFHGTSGESVELTELDSGRTRTVDYDLVIFPAHSFPDHQLSS